MLSKACWSLIQSIFKLLEDKLNWLDLLKIKLVVFSESKDVYDAKTGISESSALRAHMQSPVTRNSYFMGALACGLDSLIF